MDADALFARSRELRRAIDEATEAHDEDLAQRLRGELVELRAKAANAAFDVAGATQELVALRHQLRSLVLGNRAARTDYLGTGSPERQRFAWPTLSNRPFYEDDYDRITTRVRELEAGLVAADAMGDIPLLDSTNETKWW